MRTFTLFAALSLAAFSVAAQQQPAKKPAAPQAAKPASQASSQESAYEWRLRTEGAAGGTQPVPKRELEGVGAGAKPHLDYDLKLRRRTEKDVIAPAK